MPEAISKLLATIQESAKAVLATTKTHKWWWAGGGGATLVAIVALVVVFGGFFGPSGKAICTATLERASAYGVIPTSASLANNEAKKDDQVSGRRLCTAQVGEDKFILSVDLTCNDMKNADCLSLYAVERSDGLSTYQKRKEEPDDGAAFVPPPVEQAAAPPSAVEAPAAPADSTAPPADSGTSPPDAGDVQPVTGNNADQSAQPASPQQ